MNAGKGFLRAFIRFGQGITFLPFLFAIRRKTSARKKKNIPSENSDRFLSLLERS